MAKDIKLTFTVTEMTFATGKKARIDFFVNDTKVSLEVPAELKAYFTEQFCRPNPSPLQKKRYTTLMKLVSAAYSKGLADGKSVQPR